MLDHQQEQCLFRAVWGSEASFVDFDLDVEHIAGELTYDPPEDTSVVTHFVLYLARQVKRRLRASSIPLQRL